MIFQFPSNSTVERSNSSESNPKSNGTRTYHYKRSSTLQTAFPPSRNRDSTSSFGSESASPPPRRPNTPPLAPQLHLSRELPLKSPKRFWAFSTQSPPPLPTMPTHVRSSSTNSTNLTMGIGPEIIRRPSEAARTMKQRMRADHSRNVGPGPMELTDMEIIGEEFEAMMKEPTTAPLPSSSTPSAHGDQSRIIPVTAPLRTKNSRSSLKSVKARNRDEVDKRATIKPPPRTTLPPIPFSYTLLSHTTSPTPSSESSTIITLDFAYSTDEKCKNDSVKLTLEVLRRGGGHLLDVVEKLLGERAVKGRGGAEQRGSLESERSNPELTDGESSEESEFDSEYGLEALLRDEYLQSLMLPDSPDILKHFPPPPLPESFSITIPSSNKPRAQTRNQYAQQDKFPSPSSPYTARSQLLPLLLAPTPPKNHVHSLKISATPTRPPVPVLEPKDPARQAATLTEIRILLLRDAVPYHLITQRLIAGSFVNTKLATSEDTSLKKKVEEECRWLGMTRLAEELGENHPRIVQGLGLKHKKSGVITGGHGYI